ncbi:hypothetical protein HG535_0D00610 [Zygotorulaspora mrakii]|uniref:DNA mismatch repair protein PMS1 n=1 Tax=Zygotorulaspora mrakii TaxID=42260 RepID=A0A7H9B1U3_ZYGMR|nr:uncharacterized protein HG535_0D00610 [Zygotorulaspora mrakii]QLG72354.1 hypothetical protein HG535_0D00610 [Zygotorulaspora mrakii]
MSKINAIAIDDIHKITSGQVIIDLVTAVKELIDNSIDANARHIEVSFKNYGVESIECSDDGDGIKPENYETLALKHHTSKISNFEDVSTVKTLGFRGEALASMCAIANISVVTTSNPPRADRLEYDFNGILKSKTTTTRNKGTNVQVAQLFKNLPVRRKEFTKNCKREFTKCIALIQSYALIQGNITFTVWHTTPNGKKSRILSTGKEPEMFKKILNIYGTSSMRGLSEVNLCLDLNPFKKLMERKHVENHLFEGLDYKIVATGYISKCSFGCGRSSKDRQLVFVNARPVEYPVLLQSCNEVYKSFNNVQYPSIFINFQVPPELVDINITPDKRTVVLHNEKCVVDVFKDGLTEYYEKQELELPKSALSQPEPKLLKKRKIDGAKAESSFTSSQICQGSRGELRDENFELEELSKKDEKSKCLFGYNEDSDHEGDTITPQIALQFDNITRTPPNSETTIERKSSGENQVNRTELFIHESEGSHKVLHDIKNGIATPRKALTEYAHLSSPNASQNNAPILDNSQSVEVEIDGKKEDLQAKLSQDERLIFLREDSSHRSCCSHTSSCSGTCSPHATTNEDDEAFTYEDTDDSYAVLESAQLNVRTPAKPNQIVSRGVYRSLSDTEVQQANEIDFPSISLHVDTSIKRGAETLTAIKNKQPPKQEHFIKKNDNFENFEESEKFLTITVTKDDFIKMQVVGQFNLGFIIVTRKIGDKYDMFIVDQHASDEKYNFEVLQKITVFKSQRLIAPLPVDLNVIDEMLVIDNQPLFEKNGFKVIIDENEMPGSKIKLYSLPVSKRTLFDVDDFYELIHLIRESGGLNLESLRPSKIRSMFAMRACRSSIMIGKPLAKKTMTKVVRNLSELDKPWNCPHGRPTMRHLLELRDWGTFNDDYVI